MTADVSLPHSGTDAASTSTNDAPSINHTHTNTRTQACIHTLLTDVQLTETDANDTDTHTDRRCLNGRVYQPTDCSSTLMSSHSYLSILTAQTKTLHRHACIHTYSLIVLRLR